MSTVERNRFLISTAEVAAWLRNYGAESWWTVDGDSILGGLLSFPCPADKLAKVLSARPGSLLFCDKDQPASSPGYQIDATELNLHVNSDTAGERVLEFAWPKTPQADWLLIEDKETARMARTLEQAQK